MNRHFPWRRASTICLILMGASFYLYNLLPHSHPFQYTFLETGVTDNSSVSPYTDKDATPGVPAAPSASPSQAPAITEADIKVRGTDIALGESKESIINKLGAPFRIDETEFDFEYYIYNNDYSRLLYVAVKDDKVVGYYTDSVDFDYQGICPGSDIGTIRQTLKQSVSMSDIIQLATDTYTVQVLMDQLEAKKVTGIYVMSADVKPDEYTDDVLRNTELMVYDLVNSIRLRNKVPILAWSSSAALASRGHSQDMAEEDFFGHTNLKRESPGDRLRAEGLFFKANQENIVAGYGNAITSVHKLYNSKNQRSIMLSEKYRYLGAGFAYDADSTYQTYFTLNFYR